MKNEEMSLKTKQALAQALKYAMGKKPLSKVTISELIQTCNINRNTFYYHFADIYDLLKWMLEQEAIEVVRKIDLLINTEEAMRFVMDYVDENQHIISCAYDSMGHEEMKRFLFTDLIGVMRSAIDAGEREMGISVDIEFKDFLASFFTEAMVGMMITWIKSNPKQDREEILQNLLMVCRTAMPILLRNRANMSQPNTSPHSMK